jgi:hypothetical protein
LPLTHPDRQPNHARQSPAERPWSRRQLLQAGAGSLLAGSALAVAWRSSAQAQSAVMPHHTSASLARTDRPFDPQDTLRHFEHGRLIDEKGQRIRLFEVEARSITIPLGARRAFLQPQQLLLTGSRGGCSALLSAAA